MCRRLLAGSSKPSTTGLRDSIRRPANAGGNRTLSAGPRRFGGAAPPAEAAVPAPPAKHQGGGNGFLRVAGGAGGDGERAADPGESPERAVVEFTAGSAGTAGLLLGLGRSGRLSSMRALPILPVEQARTASTAAATVAVEEQRGTVRW